MFSSLVATLLITSISAKGAVITTFNFEDIIWSTSLTETGGNNESTVVGDTLTADKSGATGGVQITATLNSPISTVGYKNIVISFDAVSTGDLEWNATGAVPVEADDGLFIIGDGVIVDTNGINNTAAETDFDNGSSFPTANFASDFAFDSSVDDSAINNLTIRVRVNAGTEILSISNVQISGDPVLVPEPSSTLLLGLGAFTLFFRKR